MGVWQDVRFAIRLLLKGRWFTLAAVLALGLGLAANTAVFTFVNAILIRGLPFDNPDRIVALNTTDTRGRGFGVSRLDFQDWKNAKSFDGMALFLGAPMNISEEGLAAEQFPGIYISANTFQLIGQHPAIGRDFRPEDDRIEADAVVIISNNMWKTRYGGDANVLGRVIKVNSRPCTLIGVMAPGMRFPFNNDVWVPAMKLPPASLNGTRAVRNFTGFGRLAKDVSFEQARTELGAIGAQLALEYPDTDRDMRPTITPFNESVTGGQLRLIFLSLMGAVAFVLLIACANVASLLLARAAQRAREIAVRVALGASRWRIIRQLLIESVLLSTISGVAGLGLAVVAIRVFDSIVTTDVGKPYWMTFSLDPVVFAFLAAVCLATGITFGLAPALHISKTDVNDVLKDAGGRSGSSGGRARRWATALIVVEVALTLVLLAGAGFMMRSFLVLYRTDLGFDSRPLVTMRLFLPLTKYPTPEPRAVIIDRIAERLSSISALRGAAITTNPPGFGGFSRQLTVEGRPDPDASRRPEVTMVAVTLKYFDTLGVHIVRGRDFNADDGLAGHEAAIVTQRFVTMHFPGEDPIGRRITLFDPNPSVQQSPPKAAMIVGVVPSIRQRNFQEPDPDPVVYLPYRMESQRGLMLIVRAPGDAVRVTSLVRDEMRALEPDLPLVQVLTMDALLAQQRFALRVFGSMFAIFAGIAMVLSALGLYAVTAYSVAQRTAEIGIRMALGAQPGQIMWLVLRRTVLQLAIGLPVGVAGAFGVGILLRSFLVQTSSRDPVTIAAIAAMMILVALAASFGPARRATRLDPVSALRYE